MFQEYGRYVVCGHPSHLLNHAHTVLACNVSQPLILVLLKYTINYSIVVQTKLSKTQHQIDNGNPLRLHCTDDVELDTCGLIFPDL